MEKLIIGGVARSVPQPPQQQNQQPKTSVDHHQFARPSQPPPARKVSGIARPSGIAQPSRIGRPSLGAPPSTRLPAPGSRYSFINHFIEFAHKNDLSC